MRGSCQTILLLEHSSIGDSVRDTELMSGYQKDKRDAISRSVTALHCPCSSCSRTEAIGAQCTMCFLESRTEALLELFMPTCDVLSIAARYAAAVVVDTYL